MGAWGPGQQELPEPLSLGVSGEGAWGSQRDSVGGLGEQK